MHVCQYDKVKPSSKFVVVVVNWQQSLTVLKVGLPFIFIYFKCRLAAPRPYFGHCQRDSLFKRMLITSSYSAFDSKVASSLAKLNPVLSGVWIGTTFRFLSNVLTHFMPLISFYTFENITKSLLYILQMV